jgi:hypothetical protein
VTTMRILNVVLTKRPDAMSGKRTRKARIRSRSTLLA